MEFKRRERVLLIVSLLCISFLVGDRLVITPLIKLWKVRASRITELKQSLDNGTMLIDREDMIIDRWKDMISRSKIDAASDAEDQMLSSVNRWARDSNLNITSLKPRWINGNEVNKLELRLSGKGSMESIARFLFELEQDSRAVGMEDLEITAGDTRGRDMELSVRFTDLIIKESM